MKTNFKIIKYNSHLSKLLMIYRLKLIYILISILFFVVSKARKYQKKSRKY